MEMLARLRVGEWWADRATNELGRAGETLRIEPKVMEVLALLAARAGQVVSREELLSAVWPGVVVGDEALTQSIIKLRRALGDNPRSPTYIETISKRGYRLIAPVRQGEAGAPPMRPRTRLRRFGPAAAAPCSCWHWRPRTRFIPHRGPAPRIRSAPRTAARRHS